MMEKRTENSSDYKGCLELYIYIREMQVTDSSKILRLVILLSWVRDKDDKSADRNRRVRQVEKPQRYAG